MKTKLNKKMILAATILIAAVGVLAQTVAVTQGLKLPRISTPERHTMTEINQSNPYSCGQLIFNTSDRLIQYYDGMNWITDRDTLVGNEVLGAYDATLIREGNGKGLQDPYLLRANSKVIGDSIAKNIRNTSLGDTIVKYIARNGGTVTQVSTDIGGFSITNNTTTPFLTVTGGTAGQFLAQDGTWKTPSNTTYTAGTGIDINGSQVISNTGIVTVSATAPLTGLTLTKTGTDAALAIGGSPTATQYLAGNGTWQTPIDVTAHVDTIAGRGGLTIDKSKAGNDSVFKVGLVAGTQPDQILKWNGSKWVLATAASVIKKAVVAATGTYTVESVGFSGTTSADAASTIEVVGIEPIIEGTSDGSPDITVIVDKLTISTSARVDDTGAIQYTCKIQNANINDKKGFTVKGINIFYTTTGTTALNGGTAAVRTYTGW